jgi:hypothetical protein
MRRSFDWSGLAFLRGGYCSPSASGLGRLDQRGKNLPTVSRRNGVAFLQPFVCPGPLTPRTGAQVWSAGRGACPVLCCRHRRAAGNDHISRIGHPSWESQRTAGRGPPGRAGRSGSCHPLEWAQPPSGWRSAARPTPRSRTRASWSPGSSFDNGEHSKILN